MPYSNAVTRRAVSCACLLGHILFAASLYAQDNPPEKERVELRFREWFVNMEGTIRDKGHQGAGTRLDVESDLGIDGIRPSPIVEIGIEVPSVGRFTLGYSALHFRGDEVLDRDILYDDQVFSIVLKTSDSTAGQVRQILSSKDLKWYWNFASDGRAMDAYLWRFRRASSAALPPREYRS